MKRGEVWTVAGGAAYAGKPRPAVIVEDDRFDANDSIIVCPITADATALTLKSFGIAPTLASCTCRSRPNWKQS